MHQIELEVSGRFHHQKRCVVWLNCFEIFDFSSSCCCDHVVVTSDNSYLQFYGSESGFGVMLLKLDFVNYLLKLAQALFLIKQLGWACCCSSSSARYAWIFSKSDLIGLAQKISGEVRLQLRRFATGNGGCAPYGGTGPA